MSPSEINKLPYIQFVIGMLDAPRVDYEERKKGTKAKEEIINKVPDNFGTPISELDEQTRKMIR